MRGARPCTKGQPVENVIAVRTNDGSAQVLTPSAMYMPNCTSPPTQAAQLYITNCSPHLLLLLEVALVAEQAVHGAGLKTQLLANLLRKW